MSIVKMPVSGTDGNTPVNHEERKIGKKELSKEDFMKIFLAQMKMQSPTKPYDSSKMLQQMSQLTALSATEALEKTIQNMNSNLSRTQLLSASQLIGKRVQIAGGTSPLSANDGLFGSVILPRDVTKVTITIKDPHGNVVKTISKGASGSGVLDFDWNGKAEDGTTQLPPDFYKISATATIDGKEVAVTTAGTFKIGSVTSNPYTGSLILNVDGLGGVDMDDIIKIL